MYSVNILKYIVLPSAEHFGKRTLRAVGNRKREPADCLGLFSLKAVCMYTIFWRGKLALRIDPRPRFWLMSRWANCLEKHGPPLASMFSPFPPRALITTCIASDPLPSPVPTLAEMGLMANDTILNVFLSVGIPNPAFR